MIDHREVFKNTFNTEISLIGKTFKFVYKKIKTTIELKTVFKQTKWWIF